MRRSEKVLEIQQGRDHLLLRCGTFTSTKSFHTFTNSSMEG